MYFEIFPSFIYYIFAYLSLKRENHIEKTHFTITAKCAFFLYPRHLNKLFFTFNRTTLFIENFYEIALKIKIQAEYLLLHHKKCFLQQNQLTLMRLMH